MNIQLPGNPGDFPAPLPSRSRISSTIFTARSRSSSGYFLWPPWPCILPGIRASKVPGVIHLWGSITGLGLGGLADWDHR